MPLIEFVGFSLETAKRELRKYRPLLEDLPFREDIWFVLNDDTSVEDMDGAQFRFLRIRSRFKERNEAVAKILNAFEGVETSIIDFHPEREFI